MGYRTNLSTSPSALAAADAASGRSWCYAYDGNGNVSEVFGDTGESLATYLYDPFGNVAWEAGPVARENRWRFSTKLEDAETRLCYYGFRYYSAEMGRWLGRDPIGEEGGVNLYGFVGNGPTGKVDRLGLKDCCPDKVERMVDRKGSFNARKAADIARANPVTVNVNGFPLQEYVEYCGLICFKCNTHSGEPQVKATSPHQGVVPTPQTINGYNPRCDPFDGGRASCRQFGDGWQLIAAYHSHPGGSLFSPGDRQNSDAWTRQAGRSIPFFMGNDAGQFKYTPDFDPGRVQGLEINPENGEISDVSEACCE